MGLKDSTSVHHQKLRASNSEVNIDESFHVSRSLHVIEQDSEQNGSSETEYKNCFHWEVHILSPWAWILNVIKKTQSGRSCTNIRSEFGRRSIVIFQLIQFEFVS